MKSKQQILDEIDQADKSLSKVIPLIDRKAGPSMQVMLIAYFAALTKISLQLELMTYESGQEGKD